MAKRICKGSPEHEDVAHYVISSFMEHKRAEELIEKGEAMKFMSGMIHLSFYSSTSPYHTLYRQKGRVHQLYDRTIDRSSTGQSDYLEFCEDCDRHTAKSHGTSGHTHNVWYDYEDEYEYDKDLATEAIRGILEEMQSEGIEQWYRAILFTIWIENQNFSEIERQTGIPRTSISQAVSECITHIKQQLKERNIDYDI